MSIEGFDPVSIEGFDLRLGSLLLLFEPILLVPIPQSHPQPCKAGSYLRLIDSCFTQVKAQGPSRTCNESKEEEATLHATTPSERFRGGLVFQAHRLLHHSTLGLRVTKKKKINSACALRNTT